MRRIIRWVIVIIVTVMIAVQFVPVDRTNPPVSRDLGAEPAVASILRRSCYDCHSNETEWPWYSYVAPVSWLVARDVHEGREHLNFSTWDTYSPEQQAKLIREALEEVESGEMPMSIYLVTHRNAAISNSDLATLRAWANAAARAGGSRPGDRDDD